MYWNMRIQKLFSCMADEAFSEKLVIYVFMSKAVFTTFECFLIWLRSFEIYFERKELNVIAKLHN